MHSWRFYSTTTTTARITLFLFLFFSLPTLTDAYYSRYSIYDLPPSVELNVCSDSVVAVVYMGVLCDSPYTFYYGNGANRNSILCDYGDKATVITDFQLLDPLQEQDTEIYVTMAAYDDAGNFLVGTYPERLCQDYVGEDCTQAGDYSFTRKLKFGYPLGSNQTGFSPVIQMAFSTQSDSGFNLGAVNTHCPEYNQDEENTVSWTQENLRSPVTEFGIEYGILLVTASVLVGLAAFVWVRAKENPGFGHLPPYRKDSIAGEETSFMEL